MSVLNFPGDDAYLANDGSDYAPVDVEGSYVWTGREQGVQWDV